jgi:hypothetical protein
MWSQVILPKSGDEVFHQTASSSGAVTRNGKVIAVMHIYSLILCSPEPVYGFDTNVELMRNF